MGLIGSLLCKLGMHDRSRGRARRHRGTWVSHCRRCDVRMQRMPGGKWAVIKPGEAEEPVATEVEPVEAFVTDQAFPEPIAEPAAPPARSALRRTMHYLWFGRG